MNVVAGVTARSDKKMLTKVVLEKQRQTTLTNSSIVSAPRDLTLVLLTHSSNTLNYAELNKPKWYSSMNIHGN